MQPNTHKLFQPVLSAVAAAGLLLPGANAGEPQKSKGVRPMVPAHAEMRAQDKPAQDRPAVVRPTKAAFVRSTKIKPFAGVRISEKERAAILDLRAAQHDMGLER